MKQKRLAIACAVAFGIAGDAFAQGSPANASEVEQLKAQVQALQQQMAIIKEQLDRVSAAPPAGTAGTGSATASASGQPPQKAMPGGEVTAESPLSTRIGGVSLTLYGHVDVSGDEVNNGNERTAQVSSNLSYIGVRGSRDLGSSGLGVLFQVETLANVSGTPTETGGLSSRNSFIGLKTSVGNFMLGKYDTPYKRATASMDPFASSIGDYNSIMGNTGGDLRAEFDPRLPHSFFYDSPKWGGFSVNALYSPGQKLRNLPNASQYAFPQGEKVCSGATPGSSGSSPDGNVCDDGAFKNAWSIAVNYQGGPLLVTAAYEHHNATDRTSDNGGVIANESAAKIGATLHTGPNRLSGIFEKFHRNGGIASSVNERARNGYYLSDVLEVGHGNELMAAWAHAGKTPGGPDFLTADDKANMYTLGVRHRFDKQTNIYLLGALIRQGDGAHYALGAGGHGVPVASPRDDDGNTIPGKSIKGVSIGAEYTF